MFRKIGLGVLLWACGFAPAMADSVLATRNDLEQRIRAFYEAGDCDTAKSLFYTHGMGRLRKKAFAKTLEDDFCAILDRKIGSIAFQSVDPSKQEQPADFNGKHSIYTLEPTGAIVLDFGGAEPGQTKSVSLLYGLHDGKAYLVATKNAEVK